MKNLFFALLLISGILSAQWKPVSINASWGISWAMKAYNSGTIIISTNGGIFKTTDGGITWQTVSTQVAGQDFSLTDLNNIWTLKFEKSIYKTQDGGGVWIKQFEDSTKTEFLNYIRMFDINNGIAMGDALNNLSSPAFLKTTNGGADWIKIPTVGLLGGFTTDIWRTVQFLTPETGFFYPGGVTPNSLYKTTNGGINWYPLNMVNSVYTSRVIKFYNENLGLSQNIKYLPSEGCITRTKDGGITYEQFPFYAALGSDIEFVPGEPGKIWYCDMDRVCCSNDTGRTWKVVDLNVSGQLKARDILFTDANHGWLLCDNGKLYNITNADVFTSIKEDNSNPFVYNLSQNYPNPFNPTTIINYELKIKNYVSLKVYDLLGNEVATLVNKELPAGSYTAEFSAAGLSSGVYIYTLKAGGYTQSKKMQVIK